MPDRTNSLSEDATIPGVMVAPLTRMGERLAALEARATVEIAGLKDDTAVIRSSIHGINNEMQKFVQAEQQCADSLALIALQTKELPIIASSIAAFSEMRPELKGLLAEHERRVGLGIFGKRFAMIVAAAAAFVAFIGGVAGGLAWFVQHLKP